MWGFLCSVLWPIFSFDPWRYFLGRFSVVSVESFFDVEFGMQLLGNLIKKRTNIHVSRISFQVSFEPKSVQNFESNTWPHKRFFWTKQFYFIIKLNSRETIKYLIIYKSIFTNLVTVRWLNSRELQIWKV